MGRFEQIACQLIVGLHHPNNYVDDTWVAIKQNELGCFFDHIKFTQEGLKENKLAFLYFLMSVEEDRTLTVSVL